MLVDRKLPIIISMENASALWCPLLHVHIYDLGLYNVSIERGRLLYLHAQLKIPLQSDLVANDIADMHLPSQRSMSVQGKFKS